MFLGLLELFSGGDRRKGMGGRRSGGGTCRARIRNSRQRHLHAGSFVKPHARTIRVFVANCLTTIRSGFRLNDIYYYPFY